MKTYVTILIGLIVLSGAIFGANKIIKSKHVKEVSVIQDQTKMVAFNGSVVRMFEGENKINYTFSIPETATTSVDMDGALIKVKNNDNQYATVYVSYEGGRGFSPLDYLAEIVAPHVSVINTIGTSTIGAYDWQSAESEGSEWHIASVNEGQWLVIVENKKSVHDDVKRTLESLKID